MLEVFVDTLDKGGVIMFPLLMLCVLMWGAIGLRVSQMTPSATRRSLGQSRERMGSGGGRERERWRNELVRLDLQMHLRRHSTLLQSAVVVAPLLGLLGTVMGMIHTFDALGVSEGGNPAAQMSAGISQAMLTTQMGLLVSLPGLLISRLLKRRENKLFRLLCEGVVREGGRE